MSRRATLTYPKYMGTIWEQYGNNIGIILTAECSLHWQSIICTITSSSLRQSRLCYRKYVPSEKYGNNMGTIWKQYGNNVNIYGNSFYCRVQSALKFFSKAVKSILVLQELGSMSHLKNMGMI